MPTPQQELAEALQRVRKKAIGEVVRGPDLAEKDRRMLAKRGFLVPIIKGWYALTTPQAEAGDTTFWQGHFWGFASAYLRHRFGTAYCVSAENSLDLWTGHTRMPSQLVINAGRTGSFTLELPNGTSFLFYSDPDNLPAETEIRFGVQVMPAALALVRASPAFFRLSPTAAEIALRLVRPDDLSRILLGEVRYRAAAGRLIGAFRHCGLNETAERLEADLRAAALDFKETDPFDSPPHLPASLLFSSPHVGRMKALWEQMRPVVAERFPEPPGRPDAASYLRQVEEIYTRDAYNSLSIEGYHVTPEMIGRIASGAWNPEENQGDQQQRDAMAAKGYREAFLLVKKSVGDVLAGEEAPKVVNRDLPEWYRALFSPSVRAGLLPAFALAGYRNRAVFIRGSDHVPPMSEAVAELMDSLFALLDGEKHPGVRAVLGHFFLGYIHPYPDGNGRIGRFVMNALLADGGYPWTVVRLDKRAEYLAALEQASVGQNIEPFTLFIMAEMAASAALKSNR